MGRGDPHSRRVTTHIQSMPISPGDLISHYIIDVDTET